VGVVKASNTAFYAGELVASFGAVALAAGLAGLVLAAPEVRRRVAWLLPFPLAYLALILVMKIAVRRTLMPLVPVVAVLVGVGVAALVRRAAARLAGGPSLPMADGRPVARRPGARLTAAAAATLAVAGLAWPVGRSVLLLARDTNPTTRERAAAWIAERVPPGASFVQEQYTPRLPEGRRYTSRRPRHAAALADAVLEDGRWDFLLVASGSFGRFLRLEGDGDPGVAATAARYRDLFARHPLVASFRPDRWHEGPEIRLYRLDPDPLPAAAAHRFGAADAVVADDAMLPAGAAVVVYGAPGQWSLFKAYLAAGSWRLTVTGSGLGGGGALRVVTREGEERARCPLSAGGGAAFDQPAPDKVFLYLDLPPGSRLSGVELTGSPRPPGAARLESLPPERPCAASSPSTDTTTPPT
jgi:hypothetical protein